MNQLPLCSISRATPRKRSSSTFIGWRQPMPAPTSSSARATSARHSALGL
jgi:hypothetical protein